MDATKGDPAASPGDAVDRTYRWLLLLILVLGYAIYNLDKSIVSILIEPLKREFGLSDSQIGLLTGIVNSLPFALACVPVGLLADRVNRKRLLLLMVVMWSAMTALGGLAARPFHLFAARAGVGVFEAGYTPVCMSVVSDSFPRRQRATAMGIFALGAPLGVFLGLAIGGFVAAAYGWRAAFLIAGMPGLLLAIFLSIVMREPVRGRFDETQGRQLPAPFWAGLTYMFRDRALFYVAAGMTCGAVVLAVLSVWTPSFLIRVHDYPIHDAGLAAAIIVGLAGAVGAATGGALSDRLARTGEWRRLLMPVVGPLVSIAFGLVGLLAPVSGRVALAMLVPMAFFGQFYIGAGYAVTASLTPPHMRASTMAMLLIAFNIVSVNVGAMLVGTISDLLQPSQGARAISIAMATTTLFSVLAAFCFWRALLLIRERGSRV